MRLNSDIQDLGERADHQRLGQAGHAFEQAVAACENGGEQLLDHVVLADDDLLQLLLHDDAVLAELLQHFAQAFLLGGHDDPASSRTPAFLPFPVAGSAPANAPPRCRPDESGH